MSDSNHEEFFIGVDVGEGSVQAGIFSREGKMVAMETHPIEMWCPEADFVEQSSRDIWNVCCTTIQGALQSGGIDKSWIAGIGFDAICSMVVLDAEDNPVTVSPTGESAQNVIVWMNPRAIPEAEEINATEHEVLQYVGGVISPEMETTKLLWLKRHMLSSWQQAAKFLSLADFMMYRATGEDVRSLGTTVCK